MDKVKLFLTDVDGCLTDGGMYYSDNGVESKRFCVYDGMGMVLLQQQGIPCGILTSEKTSLVTDRARKLNLNILYLGVGSKLDKATCLRFVPAKAEPEELPGMTKLEAAKSLCEEMKITLDEVCFVGDDVNDIDLLRSVGYPCCPPNAIAEVRAIPGIHITRTPGGQGAIRELTDEIQATGTRSVLPK